MGRWKKWFGTNDPIAEKQLHLLEARVRELERAAAEAKPTHIYINVEHVQIDRAALENLTFKLDSLDIKELSGALNIGNNIGGGKESHSPPMEKKPKKQQPEQQQMEAVPSRNGKSGAGFTPTQTGFSYKREK